MNISNLLANLEKSPAYKHFKKARETKDAFLCAGFFIMNFKNNIFENSLDFRDDKNIFTFKIPAEKDSSKEKSEITMQKEEIMQSRKQLDELKKEEIKKIKVDIEDLRKIVEKEMQKNKITSSLDEIIAILQMQDSKLVWNLTCMAEGFTIISMQIDAIEDKVLKFEKKNLLDFVSVKKPGELKSGENK